MKTRLCLLAVLCLAVPASLRAGDDVRIHPDLIYGRKDGMALTLDVIKPAKANGAGILWIQSGGWYSNWVDAKVWLGAAKPFLDKGFTMFIVRHGSAPKYAIPEAAQDVRRSVRFIRLKAKEYGVDPERLGVMGGSAGGHLSLLLGTTGDDGNSTSKDAVLKERSHVAAVVALYPPTDISDWVTNPPEAIKKIPALKPPLTFAAKLAPDLSPLLKVTEKSAPALMIHGDKDELVPIDHSRNMVAAMEKAKATAKLITIEGAGHSFTAKQNQEIIVPAMVGWFEKHLAERKE